MRTNKLLYVAGPYAGDTKENIVRAEEVSISLIRNGFHVFTPHKNTSGYEQYADNVIGLETWMGMDLDILSRCDAMYVMKNSECSIGVQKETAFARENKIPIFHEGTYPHQTFTLDNYLSIVGKIEPIIDWNNDLRTELAGSITRTGVIIQGEVDLSSGNKSTYYVDIKKACTNPSTFWLITKSISKMISVLPYTIEGVAGIELGSVPIAACVSHSDPFIIVRKEKKGHGVGDEVIGDVRDKRIIVIEDVTTTGSSSVKAIKRIREEGGIVNDVITVVDRNEGAKECLEDIGVGLIPLLEFKNLRLC